jgi:hypothetical protein
MPPMPEGWYPHEPGGQFYELDWVFLHEHPHILERHWELAWRGASVSAPVATPADRAERASQSHIRADAGRGMAR